MKLRHIIIILIFILINLFIILSFFRGKETEEVKSTTEFVATLAAQRVENAVEKLKVSGFGTVSSFNSVDIACEVQGQLNKGKHELKPGVNFRQGDLLFKINDADAQYTLRSRKSGFINILASLLPDIQIDFPAEFDKWNDYINSIKLNESLPQLPVWKTNKEKIFLSTRNVLTEYFSIKSLETQTNKHSVYAPFNGVITDVYTTNYSVVNPGTKVLRIVETSNFEIPVSIPADEIQNIKIGTDVSVYTTTGTLKGHGNVIRISQVINRNTQSIPVYVRPKSIEGAHFTEGEYVRVEINEEGEYEGVRVPNSAVTDHSVYVYSKTDSVLSVQPVTIFDTNREGVFIKGLKDGDIVITQEVLNYTDTTKYQVLIK